MRRGDRDIDLTKTEFDLLSLLMEHAGIVLSREQIYEHIWGFDFETGSRSLDVYIGYLRRKTEAEGEPRLVHTVRGVGYVVPDMSLKWRIALGMAAIAALVSIVGRDGRVPEHPGPVAVEPRRVAARQGARHRQRPDRSARATAAGPARTGGFDDVCPRADFLQPATIAQFISADGDAQTCLGVDAPRRHGRDPRGARVRARRT